MVDFLFHIDNQMVYPISPFHPDSDYPEFNGMFNHFDNSNLIYKNVRNLFINAGYDNENIDTNKWNPFRNYIKEGQLVVIKPNLVFEETDKLIGKNCLTTNASIIRPIIDYLMLLQKIDAIEFKIIIADIPIQGANFNKILEQTGLNALNEYYINNHSIDLQIVDLRHKIAIVEESGYFNTVSLQGDPCGYTKIHLEKSFLNEIANDYKKFGAPGYGIKETYSQIEETGSHFYHIPNTILKSDFFINIPKIKTHKKAGITIALKNLIGINGEKAWIPHFRRGSVKYGGDEFDDNQVFLKSITTKANILLQGKSKILWELGKNINSLFIKRFFRKDLKKSTKLNDYERKALFLVDGNWYGNDTIWRPILDLNYLLLFCDKKGIINNKKQRNYICISDGIIAGEGDGPLVPYPKKLGLLCLSENPVINDVCCSRLMGFNWEKIPLLKNSVKIASVFDFDGDVAKIQIIRDINDTTKKIHFNNLPNFEFLPPPGWLKHIEL